MNGNERDLWEAERNFRDLRERFELQKNNVAYQEKNSQVFLNLVIVLAVGTAISLFWPELKWTAVVGFCLFAGWQINEGNRLSDAKADLGALEEALSDAENEFLKVRDKVS